jgi:hypothetical protein
LKVEGSGGSQIALGSAYQFKIEGSNYLFNIQRKPFSSDRLMNESWPGVSVALRCRLCRYRAELYHQLDPTLINITPYIAKPSHLF